MTFWLARAGRDRRACLSRGASSFHPAIRNPSAWSLSAASSGLPLLLTEMALLAEEITELGMGIACNTRNITAFAAALRTMADMPTESWRMSVKSLFPSAQARKLPGGMGRGAGAALRGSPRGYQTTSNGMRIEERHYDEHEMHRLCNGRELLLPDSRVTPCRQQTTQDSTDVLIVTTETFQNKQDAQLFCDNNKITFIDASERIKVSFSNSMQIGFPTEISVATMGQFAPQRDHSTSLYRDHLHRRRHPDNRIAGGSRRDAVVPRRQILRRV